jgi:hypothetical protein
VYAYRGQSQEWFTWLERAYKQRDPGLPEINRDPLFRNLHGDPRYAELLKKCTCRYSAAESTVAAPAARRQLLVGSEDIYRREERRSLNRVVELGHPKEKCPQKTNSEESISTLAAGIR